MMTRVSSIEEIAVVSKCNYHTIFIPSAIHFAYRIPMIVYSTIIKA